MAAYGALLSLMDTVNQINNHPRPPIVFHEQHLHSLTLNLTFLLDFLEHQSSQDDDDVDTRITAAAYAARDAIETLILGKFYAGSTAGISSDDLRRGLDTEIQRMDLIKTELMGAHPHDHLHRNSSIPIASTLQISTLAEFDESLINEVLDKLSGQQSNLQIIPIVGMGGIGKTTFARNIYSNQLIIHHFDIRSWVTVSQEFDRKKVLQFLVKENTANDMSEEKLGEKLYKYLWGRRYLIVMDDIWSIDAWYRIKSYFPDNNNGSRIMITTRLSSLALDLNCSHVVHMSFLNEDKSWDLLCKIVFGEESGCPRELENIGKEIAKNCRGLPLSIVVTGGLLKKSKGTQEHWQHTFDNLNSLINLEDGEYCLQILRRSYKELPLHLKPCFLFMGIFPEDHEIHVSDLIEQWVAEGILRPVDDRRIEEVSEQCVKELIDRNLILVHQLRWNGEAKVCKIHDLLRDVCLREARKLRFLDVVREKDHNASQVLLMERRFGIHRPTKEQFGQSAAYISITRSFLYRRPTYGPGNLRVYSVVGDKYIDVPSSGNAYLQQANLRYLSLKLELDSIRRLNHLWCSLWNIQTLKVVIPYSFKPIIAPSEIWKMPVLKHALLDGFHLPHPFYEDDNFVLEHLQKLSGIINFKCSEEVVKRIPNIMKLGFEWRPPRLDEEDKGFPDLCLENLGHLQNLKSLNFDIDLADISHEVLTGSHLVQRINFPHSLKKLTLKGTLLEWEELTTKIGSLPHLEYLKLDMFSCDGLHWETEEGKFCSLKFLHVGVVTSNLMRWTTDSTHFPLLEHLVLANLEELEGVPSSIGDIPTLKSIKVVSCSKSAEDSARRIKEEQEDYGNEVLQVLILEDLEEY